MKTKLAINFLKKNFCTWPKIGLALKGLTLSGSTRRYKHRQNKVKVKGLGSKSSYLDGFSFFFFFCGSMKKFNQLTKKKKKKKKIL